MSLLNRIGSLKRPKADWFVGSLGWRGARGALLGVLGVGFIAGFAGWVRVMPWVFAPELPLGVVLPFGRLLAASALEVSVVVGAPVGLLVSWHVGAKQGELSALAGLGLSPVRFALGQLPWLGGVTAPLLALALWVSGPIEAAPGRVFSDLVSSAQNACDDGRAVVPVPGSGLVQHCASGSLVGRVPSRQVWFSAGEFTLSARASSLLLGNAQVFLPAEAGTAAVVLSATKVTVRGLPAPFESSRGQVRALGLWLAQLATGLWLADMLRAPQISARAVVSGLAGCLATLAALKQLDAAAFGSASYLALVGVPVAVALLASQLLHGLGVAIARLVRR